MKILKSERRKTVKSYRQKRFMRKRKLTSILSAAVIVAGALAPAMAPVATFADENPKLVLKVQDQGGTDYLNGATYDVYLKYLLDDNGKLLNPKTFQEEVNQVNDHGMLPDLSAAYKMGTVTINGQLNEFPISSVAHPALAGKNLGRAIYTIVPVKRAPGYLKDVRPDGKYAEVEFPKLQADGALDPDQTFTIDLKFEKATKPDGDLNLIVKKNEKGEALQGITFKLKKTGTPKTIGDDNRVEDWNLVDEDMGEITSGQDGKLLSPSGSVLPEGRYSLIEQNAQEKGFSKIGDIEFTYTADAQNKMKIKFTDGENSVYVKADGEAENGDGFSLFNYEDLNPQKETIGSGGEAGTEVNVVSPNTPYGYRINFKFPADYKKYKSVSVEDVFADKLKPLFNPALTSVGGSDLSQEISVWYEKPVVGGSPAEKVEITKDEHYTIAYDESGRKLSLTMTADQMKKIGKLAHNIDEDAELPKDKLPEMGKVFIQFKAQVDGKKLSDADFEPSQPGVDNKVDGKYEKNLNPSNDGPDNPGNGEDPSNTKKTKVVRVKVKMMKTDGSGGGLENAEFQIFANRDGSGEPLKQYDSDEPYTVKSDSQGYITAEKLPYLKGGYYFKEIKAPTGFRLPKALFHFETRNAVAEIETIGDVTNYDYDLGTHSVADQIVNVKKDQDITNTGTMGTLASLFGGAGILGAGVLFNRKKKSQK